MSRKPGADYTGRHCLRRDRHVHTPVLALALVLTAACATQTESKPVQQRDPFYWLGEINKATLVINTDQACSTSMAPRLAAGLAKVLEAGAQPGAGRPSTVISFEPLLIKEAGEDVTLLHAGRSSQDMHATYRSAILRDKLLELADQLNQTSATLVALAGRHAATIVPNTPTAWPRSQQLRPLPAGAGGLMRDAQRIREAYVRIDRSPMGTTVLNGTSWPLDRERMARYLGFEALVDNAYDAAQISSMDQPVEVASIVASIALRTGNFVEDVTQYAQSRPWILLEEGGGNTYVSSAMPQKRNPGLLNDTRSDASTALTLAMGPLLQTHNITPGMSDPKDVKQNSAMVDSGIAALKRWDRVLKALVISPDRALEELNSDWTASQELADLLMRKYKLPFRDGHHFASEVVAYAKTHGIKPLDFPTPRRAALCRVAEGFQVRDRAADERGRVPRRAGSGGHREQPRTLGGPQPAEMARMLKDAGARLAEQMPGSKRAVCIQQALDGLDRQFDVIVSSAAQQAEK